MSTEENKAVARRVYETFNRAISTGNMSLLGDFQGIPTTGKQVTQTGIDILRIAGGKVVERWGQFDDLGLLQQLGVVPPPSG